jgi:acyl-coenzyme A thioesterase PaaI-like protein
MSPRLFRLLMNLYPPYLGTGIRVTRVSADFSEVDVEMRLHWYNGNAFGTHFGGSLYAMVDPFLVLMTVQQIGSDYIVWDKAAQIDFIAPGRGTVYAKFRMPRDEIARLQAQAASGQPVAPQYPLEILDRDGKRVARVVKTLYVRRKKDRGSAA